MKLVSTAEMQQVEREADKNGLTYEMMMEQAGQGLAAQVARKFEADQGGGVLGLVGSGNNGGDTLVALALLAKQGWRASAYLARARAKGDRLVERLVASGGAVIDSDEDEKYKLLKRALGEHAVLMDGILGTGIKLPLRGSVREVLRAAGKVLPELLTKPKIVAVDCPSGVDCDSGEAAEESLVADLTVTMAAVKQGLLKFPANELIGELVLVGIGLNSEDQRAPTWQMIQRHVVSAEMVRDLLPLRSRDAHKGTFGTALIIAGSVNFTGAALLAGMAAYRVGVGLVTMGVPAPLHSALAGEFPEGTWLLLPHEMGVIAEGAEDIVRENLGNSSGMLLGPGFGMEDTTRNFLKNLFVSTQRIRKSRIGFVSVAEKEMDEQHAELPPAVIDADGLKLLSKLDGWRGMIPSPAVLTPHPGEMSVMTGLPVEAIQADRIGNAERFSKEWGHIVVLKGANTVIAEPDGRTCVVPVADPALARAGSGDVLAGVITSLRAQGLAAYEAALCGAWIHAQSGLFAAKKLGTSSSVIAGDLITELPSVLQFLAR